MSKNYLTSYPFSLILNSKFSILLRVGEYCRRLYVHAVVAGEAEDGEGEARLEIFGAIAEVGFGGTYMGGVGHGVFAAFGETVKGVGELFALHCV